MPSEDTQFKKGKEWNGNKNGRPPGISITGRIRQIFAEDPKLFEKTVREYMKDKKARDLMWRMIDGNPKQAITGDKDSPLEVIIRRINETGDKPTTKTG